MQWGRSGYLEADDSGGNETYAGQAHGGGWITEKNDAAYHDAGRSYPGPYRVSGADGQGLGGQTEERDADHQRGSGAGSGPPAGEAIGKLETEGPGDLKETGENKKNPGHDDVLAVCQGRP